MMFMIAYKANNPGDAEKTLEKIDEVLAALGPRTKGIFDNVWLLEARLNAPNIRDLLKNAVNTGDRIFVARIAQNWAGMNMGGKPPFPEWLNARNFGTFGNTPAKEEAPTSK